MDHACCAQTEARLALADTIIGTAKQGTNVRLVKGKFG